jgi:predicted lactoylglutathione lyase
LNAEKEQMMEQRLSVVTIGITDLDRTKTFYVDGFGWNPAYEDHEVIFFQLNGIALSCYLQSSMIAEAHLPEQTRGTGLINLAYNVRSREEVEPLMRLAANHGGTIIAPAVDRPEFGGCSGYVADPDGHPWEICWNPKSPIDDEGNLTFGG